MTKEEAFERLEEAVKRNGSAQFKNLEDAFNVTAQSLNYIMDQVEDLNGPEDKDAD